MSIAAVAYLECLYKKAYTDKGCKSQIDIPNDAMGDVR